MGVITAFFVRLLRMCSGRLFTGFLLIRQEVRAIFKTCNRLIGYRLALSQITENRKVWTRKSLICQQTIFGFCPEKAILRQSLDSPLTAASFELCEDPLEHLRPFR